MPDKYPPAKQRPALLGEDEGALFLARLPTKAEGDVIRPHQGLGQHPLFSAGRCNGRDCQPPPDRLRRAPGCVTSAAQSVFAPAINGLKRLENCPRTSDSSGCESDSLRNVPAILSSRSSAPARNKESMALHQLHITHADRAGYFCEIGGAKLGPLSEPIVETARLLLETGQGKPDDTLAVDMPTGPVPLRHSPASAIRAQATSPQCRGADNHHSPIHAIPHPADAEQPPSMRKELLKCPVSRIQHLP
jgi:hypothetical protein